MNTSMQTISTFLFKHKYEIQMISRKQKYNENISKQSPTKQLHLKYSKKLMLFSYRLNLSLVSTAQ